MTVCNMSIEAGARAGMVAPDDITFAYLEGRPTARRGDVGGGAGRLAFAVHRRAAPASTRRSTSTRLGLTPYVSWGTNPAQVVPIGGVVPDPDDFDDPRPRRPPSGPWPTWV